MTRSHSCKKSAALPASDAVPLLAGFDTIMYSSRTRISQEVRAQLAEEKEAAHHKPGQQKAPALVLEPVG